ncbi:hypothetical protein EV363DRAFT_1308943, partial [Boletus edulis]
MATSMHSHSTRACGGCGTLRSGEARTSMHGPCASGKARANDSAWAVHRREGGGGPCMSGEQCRWWGWGVGVNDGHVMTFVHVGRVEGTQAGEWLQQLKVWSFQRHCGDQAVTIVTLSLLPHCFCECDDVRARTGQGQGWGAHEVGRCGVAMRAREVCDSIRACWARRGPRASGGMVEAPTRPQTRHSIFLGDKAPTRHGLCDLLLLTEN